MDTYELLPTLAQGELSATSSPELVAAVFRARASGTLWLETPDKTEIRFYFRAGEMCGTGGFKGAKSLAQVLLEKEWLDALDIDATREQAQKANKHHGEVLVESGLLTADKLKSALAEQHRANLHALLALRDARYDWHGWEPPPSWAREAGVDPIGAIVEALEAEAHAARRAHILKWVGAHRLRLSMDWPELQARVNLTPAERKAAGLLAVPRTVREFVAGSKVGPERAEALLVALLLAGGAEPEAASAAAGDEVDEDALEPLEDDAGPEAIPDAAVIPEPAGAPARKPERARNALLDEREAISRLDALDLEAPPGRAAPVDEPLEIDRGPRQGGRVAAPAPSHDELELDESGSGAAASGSRDVRRKLVQRGMRNLGAAPAAPSTYGRVEAEPTTGPVDVESLGAEDQRFVSEAQQRAQIIDRQNAYARLGLTAAATTDMIKQAYLTAAKRFHPDRASADGLQGLEPELRKIFNALKEAYEQISSPEKRAKYDRELKTGASTSKATPRREEAIVAMKMGEVLLKKKDYDGALQKLRRAVDLDANGETLAALAWGIASDPRQQGKEEAASLINRALRAPGVTARTYYVAGVLWRTKDPDSAADAFRKAIEADPRHADAALELRLIEQRRGKSGAGKDGGVLSGLLFGKRKPSS